MKKRTLTTLFAVALAAVLISGAHAVSLAVDGVPVTENVVLYNSTTYVPLRATSQLLSPEAQVDWSNGQASVTTGNLNLAARPGEMYLQANDRALYAPDGVKLANGSTLVPVRVLAKAFGASVSWDDASQQAIVQSGGGAIESGGSYYDETSLYWLSRIIHAESSGESLKGKIGVGNVILNRVASSAYPNSIYDVIFDTKYGTQFQPISNGTIYNTPSEESVLAAKLCLDGASVVGNSLYFFNPTIASSSWISQNCTYITTIGNHQFYS